MRFCNHLPSFDFGRIAAQTAKQVINFNVREAERERQFNDFVLIRKIQF